MKSGLIDGVTVCCGYDFGTDANMARYCPICGKELVKKNESMAYTTGSWKTILCSSRKRKRSKKILDALAGYDIFQFNNNIKPDFSNASGNELIGIYCKAG